ncbi:hypothetical protein Scep_023346 [Stephania cephalantha]|uniref:Uncharacterized protein n=1 Tax=Stephania cephalantha TaxID=152367 RepID=A0AAP0HX76_9MAGN
MYGEVPTVSVAVKAFLLRFNSECQASIAVARSRTPRERWRQREESGDIGGQRRDETAMNSVITLELGKKVAADVNGNRVVTLGTNYNEVFLTPRRIIFNAESPISNSEAARRFQSHDNLHGRLTPLYK